MDGTSHDWIEKFMEQWPMREKYYDYLAEGARQQCEKLLGDEGIKAEFKHRVKDSERLRTKCTNRVKKEEKKYNSLESISADVIDLAGVRIALYFPNQKTNVKKLIHGHFDVKEVKYHSGWEQKPVSKQDAESRSELQSPGYVAEHYRVHFKPKHDHLGGLVEIQVMSVLNNAWSNVGHDITYKALSGKVSAGEMNILNGLNGLLFTGDWLLEMFHDSYVARVTHENAPFANHFELGAYLSKRFSQKIQQQEGGMKLGLVKVMYQLLEIIAKRGVKSPAEDSNANDFTQSGKPKLNTPQGLELVIKDLDFEDKPNSNFSNLKKKFGECEMTISVYLMHHILSESEASDPSPALPDWRMKYKIMLSTVLWLDELFPASFALEDNLLRKGTERDRRVVKWLHKHEEPREVFLYNEDGDSEDDDEDPKRVRQQRISGYVDDAWSFFQHAATTEHADVVVEFAFKLSRRGVLWSFPDDFARVQRREFGQDWCFPTWR